MSYKNIKEEELKLKVAQDYFSAFDTTQIIGNIDFCVAVKEAKEHVVKRNFGLSEQKELFKRCLLWAEAKRDNKNITDMFAQLLLTIGKERPFNKHDVITPFYLGVFDFNKIAFLEYDLISSLFFQNDFNWNITPSSYDTKEFKQIKELIEETLKKQVHIFYFGKDDIELVSFIKNNIAKANNDTKIKITKNNFYNIYLRWLEFVKPAIGCDFEGYKERYNILDSDFYLADLFVDDKDTIDINDDMAIKDNLAVIFRKGGYKVAKENFNILSDYSIEIKDTHIYEQFWKRYKRPPLKKFHNYILDRKDLLVPQNIREIKGAFYTPRAFVELSQEYLAKVFEQDYQDEYYIWDCACGTGNLLVGLLNAKNIFASTLDQTDISVIHDFIDNKKLNLIKDQVFQFDFLNDDFFDKKSDKGGGNKSKLPLKLQEILKDENKREKLIIYINPPYAEATNKGTISGTGEHKPKVATANNTYLKYANELSKASNELFVQFLIRIYIEIPKCSIANFSKLKSLQGSNFKAFKQIFKPKLENLFLVPSYAFDNVNGKFSIGFFIWNGRIKQEFKEIKADVYNEKGEFLQYKNIYSYDEHRRINQWIAGFNDKDVSTIGYMINPAPDFQHNNGLHISTKEGTAHNNYTYITADNLIEACIYFSVRHCIKANWLNDRDQFLYPNELWENDLEFQSDCLAFTLFHTQNRITAKDGTNHFIPFSQEEVGINYSTFTSSFMYDFIKGKIKVNPNNDNLFSSFEEKELKPIEFSTQALEVFKSGLALWKYYHSFKSKDNNININSSFYDIREYFQGRNEKGKMNSSSSDETYTKLLNDLRTNIKALGLKIEPKIYAYEFLKE